MKIIVRILVSLVAAGIAFGAGITTLFGLCFGASGSSVVCSGVSSVLLAYVFPFVVFILTWVSLAKSQSSTSKLEITLSPSTSIVQNEDSRVRQQTTLLKISFALLMLGIARIVFLFINFNNQEDSLFITALEILPSPVAGALVVSIVGLTKTQTSKRNVYLLSIITILCAAYGIITFGRF